MGLIQTVFGVLTLIAGGVSIMLVVSTKTLRDSRDDLSERVRFLEDERIRDRESLAEKDTAIKFWRSAATGDEKLDGLTELLTEHHNEARQNWTLVNAGLGHVGTAIDHMGESLDSLIETLGGKQ